MTTLQQQADRLDWEHLESNTRYLAHGIHRYSGKFIPQIASQAISLTSEPGELVLDVYAGSGTTLLEAALRERTSIGIDLNPLACLIAAVKTTPVQKSDLQRFHRWIEDELTFYTAGQSTLLGASDSSDLIDQVQSDPRWHDEWFTKWFPPDRLRELLYIYHLLGRVPSFQVRNVGLTAFSEVIRQSSMANTSYPNVMFDRNRVPRRSAVARFLRKLSDVCAAVEGVSKELATKPHPTVIQGSACMLPIGDKSVASIVTHPPYIGSIPYAEYGALSLMWLGADPKVLDRNLTGGRRQSRDVVDRFHKDFAMTFQECARVLRPNRHLVMLLGSPTVRGVRIDLPRLATVLASDAGFTVDAMVARQGGNRRANLMAEEKLLFFRLR